MRQRARRGILIASIVYCHVLLSTYYLLAEDNEVTVTISQHARQQAATKKLAIALIWEVAQNPENTYPSFQKDSNGNRTPYICRRCGAEQQKWTGTASDGTRLCLVVNPCCREVVTVWLDQLETALREDQIAKGVTGYAGINDRPTKRAGKPLTAKQKRAKKKARLTATAAKREQAAK